MEVFVQHQIGVLRALAEQTTQKLAALEQQRDLIDRTSGQVTHLFGMLPQLESGFRRQDELLRLLRELGTPCLIHQPSYSMLNRWIEQDLLSAVDDLGVGVIAFSPLAQGMLTDRYLNGVPEDSRAAQGKSLDPSWLTDDALTDNKPLFTLISRYLDNAMMADLANA